MGSIVHILRAGMEGFLTPFDWLGPFWGLTVLSILSGIAMLWVVGKTTPQKRVEKARNKMDSAVYEIRLFLDYPKRVLISLGRLMGNSVLYIAYMMPAFIILALPLTFMYLGLETRHGMEPIAVEQPFVVSVELADGVDGRTLRVEPESNLEITAEPLYVKSENKVYIRAKASSKGTSTLLIEVGGQSIEKRIVSDASAIQMQPDRASGLDLLFSFGPEANLDGPITKIGVVHQIKNKSFLGMSRWVWWWLFLMMVAAFGLKKPMGVTL